MKLITILCLTFILSSCGWKYSVTKARIEFKNGKPTVYREGPTVPLKDTVLYGYTIDRH